MKAEELRYPSLEMSAPRQVSVPLALYLSYKEIIRNKGRYLLICAVVGLITTLVLFISALAQGLGSGNKEYIDNLNASHILYQANVDLSIPSSRLPWSELRAVRRVEGVIAVGPIGFSNASLVQPDDDLLSVSLIGVEPGLPGEPPVRSGEQLFSSRANDVIIDQGVALRTDYQVGQVVTIKSVVGAEEEFYDLRIVGISDSQQYSIQPSIFVPLQTWNEVKPRSNEAVTDEELVFNIMAVQTDDRVNFAEMQSRIQSQVADIEAIDRTTAYENTPGYGPQQSTLNTQRFFTLLIGVLVVGGFFRIQALQKVTQVGMLKAIGASSRLIIATALIQIFVINLLGVSMGGLGTLALAQLLPPTIPLVFEQTAVLQAVSLLLLIGPLGGLASLQTLLKAEPLTALGLAT